MGRGGFNAGAFNLQSLTTETIFSARTEEKNNKYLAFPPELNKT
jgi:hypothetical protein